MKRVDDALIELDRARREDPPVRAFLRDMAKRSKTDTGLLPANDRYVQTRDANRLRPLTPIGGKKKCKK